MQITITDAAAEKIREKIQNQHGYLKLKYDTEGTGCVMNGVPILWHVNEPVEGDIKIETNQMPILVEKSKMVFYDKEIKIDYSNQSGMFQLKSPGQTINGRMSFKNQ
ncbi:iron-sulfur cluster biosynthesis family protein [Jeotgalibacillus sp. S-D1]|uniref:iron-sulfur cluster biosynthesis family protein n=1 Tax=Jeotgalibacillus sp. S-D1 TaxID=2552189 RepID=UPI001059BB85|nr:iron-sulfur cluster biosynthesis family protein [Jeotgalibacillus sp. S-D1]TDL34669.1 iron-sulfur cluster biosynthesis family protein [Jeotgalibacillus sp. S-D1]